MNMRSIIGTWKGFYEYGSGYPIPYFAERVEIEMQLNGDNDKFTGNCIEFESEISDNMQSEIFGFVDDEYISFRKIYQDTFTIENNGEITKQLNKESVVFYSGNYDIKTDCIFGFWEYSAEENGLEDDEMFANFGGIWKCNRVV